MLTYQGFSNTGISAGKMSAILIPELTLFQNRLLFFGMMIDFEAYRRLEVAKDGQGQRNLDVELIQ
jgi:hypothetical protein